MIHKKKLDMFIRVVGFQVIFFLFLLLFPKWFSVNKYYFYFTHTHIYTYTHMHIYVCVCVYIYIYIYKMNNCCSSDTRHG